MLKRFQTTPRKTRSVQDFHPLIALICALLCFSAIPSSAEWKKFCGKKLTGMEGCFLLQSVISKESSKIGASVLFHRRGSIAPQQGNQPSVVLRISVPYGVPKDRNIVLMNRDDKLFSLPITKCVRGEGCFVDYEPPLDTLQKITSAQSLQVVYQVDKFSGQGLPFDVGDLNTQLLALEVSDSNGTSEPESFVATVRYLKRGPNGECMAAYKKWTVVQYSLERKEGKIIDRVLFHSKATKEVMDSIEEVASKSEDCAKSTVDVSYVTSKSLAAKSKSDPKSNFAKWTEPFIGNFEQNLSAVGPIGDWSGLWQQQPNGKKVVFTSIDDFDFTAPPSKTANEEVIRSKTVHLAGTGIKNSEP